MHFSSAPFSTIRMHALILAGFAQGCTTLGIGGSPRIPGRGKHIFILLIKVRRWFYPWWAVELVKMGSKDPLGTEYLAGKKSRLR
ncbi:hypothetical protein V8C37DRAFT_386449 [Trichoderma ceciliae]